MRWIKRYIFSHDKHATRHPKDMGPQEIGAFLTRLTVEKEL
jgi:hypothetical protein